MIGGDVGLRGVVIRGRARTSPDISGPAGRSGERPAGSTPVRGSAFVRGSATDPVPRGGGHLPAWPVTAPFAGYILWWVLGIGDMVWILAGGAALVLLLGTRGLRLPPGILIWLLFLAWVVASLTMVDSTGRLIGAVYRLLLYGAAACLGVYAYAARQSLPLWRITATMTLFLAGMTLGGLLAMALPELVIRTPLSLVVPQGLIANELVGEMVIRRTSQWKPDAWEPQAVRPAAPFLYTNTWGNVYSLVLPLSVLHVSQARSVGRRWATVAVIAVSVVPAVSTLNRGMFVGLGVVAAWCAVQALRRGDVVPVVVGGAAVVVAVGAWAVSPAGSAFLHRVETTESTTDRAELYRMTLEGTAASPLLGFGAPRPAPQPWLPSLGTQGQLWTVLFSHGFVGLALFLGYFVVLLPVVLRRIDTAGAVLGGVVLATLVETFYYGMMTGIMVSVVAGCLLMRPDTVISTAVGRRRSAPRASRSRPRPPGGGR